MKNKIIKQFSILVLLICNHFVANAQWVFTNPQGVQLVANKSNTNSYSDGLALDAKFSNDSNGFAEDSHGNIIMVDYGNNLLRKLDITTNLVSSIVGNKNPVSTATPWTITAGNVVYAAQNLYNTLIGDIVYFSDECSSISGTAARGVKKSSKKKEVVMSNINVYPNPSKGEININFNKADAGLKQFTITDIYGKTVWQQQSSFSSGILKANLNVANGIYFLNISNNKNNTKYVQKIVINN